MKTLAILLLSSVAVACPSGTILYQGMCADVPAPKDTVPVPEVKPSDEKPSHHPEAAWERGEVNAATPPSLVTEDAKLDQQKAQAEEQGKKAAGLK